MRFLAAFLFALSFLTSCKHNDFTSFNNIFVLDTVMSLTIEAENEYYAKKVLNKLIKEVKRLDKIFNIYKKESEISRINKNAFDKYVAMSQDLGHVFFKSVYFHKITGGAFNATLLSLKKIWDFSNPNKFILPDKNKIKKALENTGHDFIRLRGNKISLLKRGVGLELGGIAKGYIIDRFIEIIKSSGIKNALLNIGGDVYALGKKGVRKWRIGIKHPRKRKNSIYKVLNVSNKSVVTSGDYERFLIIDNKRYHHIIDPATGMPSYSSISATVIADDAITADALSTAIFILGPKKGISLIEKLENVEALILFYENNKLKQVSSSGFSNYVASN